MFYKYVLHRYFQRYKALLKKLKNETEKVDFSLDPDEDDGGRSSKGKKKISYSARRAAEFLDYGIINPSEEELREMFHNKERQSRVNFHTLFTSSRLQCTSF